MKHFLRLLETCQCGRNSDQELYFAANVTLGVSQGFLIIT